MAHRDLDYGRCYYCGHRLTRRDHTTDHLVPVSRGGSDHDTNLVKACKACNGDKGCLSVDEFRAVLALRRGRIPPFNFTFFGETSEWT